MKKLIVPVVALAVLAISACGGSKPAATPEEAVKAFFAKFSKLDIDGAKKYATKESAQFLDLMKMGIEMGKNAAKGKADDELEKMKNTKFEVGTAKIDGDEAKVPVTADGKTKDITVKKEDGSWKVAFDKSTMMKDGLEGAGNQEGKESMEKIDEMSDTLKGMLNNDNTKEAMDKAKELMNDPAVKEAAGKIKEQLSDPKKMKELQETLEKLKENQ